MPLDWQSKRPVNFRCENPLSGCYQGNLSPILEGRVGLSLRLVRRNSLQAAVRWLSLLRSRSRFQAKETGVDSNCHSTVDKHSWFRPAFSRMRAECGD